MLLLQTVLLLSLTIIIITTTRTTTTMLLLYYYSHYYYRCVIYLYMCWAWLASVAAGSSVKKMASRLEVSERGKNLN